MNRILLTKIRKASISKRRIAILILVEIKFTQNKYWWKILNAHWTWRNLIISQLLNLTRKILFQQIETNEPHFAVTIFKDPMYKVMNNKTKKNEYLFKGRKVFYTLNKWKNKKKKSWRRGIFRQWNKHIKQKQQKNINYFSATKESKHNYYISTVTNKIEHKLKLPSGTKKPNKHINSLTQIQVNRNSL